MNVRRVGEGKVSLIAGGGRIYTDVAARFTRSEGSLDEIISAPYDQKLVETIVSSGHKAAVEFDYFIFGVEGYSRVTEVQLVRKRHASYLIKSGRVDKKGIRSYDVVLPDSIRELKTYFRVSPDKVRINGVSGEECFGHRGPNVDICLGTEDILTLLESWYNYGVLKGYKEEELRYLKPQATEFKAIIGMNAHALCDWFMIRMCKNAQTEIRDLATKMYNLCVEVAPDLFKDAGPSCKVLGYCPENKMQNKTCNTIRKSDAMRVLREYSQNIYEGKSED